MGNIGLKELSVSSFEAPLFNDLSRFNGSVRFKISVFIKLIHFFKRIPSNFPLRNCWSLDVEAISVTIIYTICLIVRRLFYICDERGRDISVIDRNLFTVKP